MISFWACLPALARAHAFTSAGALAMLLPDANAPAQHLARPQLQVPHHALKEVPPLGHCLQGFVDCMDLTVQLHLVIVGKGGQCRQGLSQRGRASCSIPPVGSLPTHICVTAGKDCMEHQAAQRGGLVRHALATGLQLPYLQSLDLSKSCACLQCILVGLQGQHH